MVNFCFSSFYGQLTDDFCVNILPLFNVERMMLCVLFGSDVLLSAAYQWRKNVIIAIDIGNSLSETQLHITKAIAKHLVFSLGDNDWVSSHF